MSETLKRIGILTGGGDCPGLNAVIRAVAKAAIGDQRQVIGQAEIAAVLQLLACLLCSPRAR